MEFVSAIVPLVLEYSIGPIARHVSYPFNYKTKVTGLEDGVQELKSARDSRQRWVNELERNGKVIDQDVLDWLKDVGGFIEEEEAELGLANENTKKKCCLGFCPNLKARYQVSKKAEQKAVVAARFSEKNGEFSTHYHTPALQCTEGFSSKDFKALESRMSILKDIMNALTSVDLDTIGVHGVGGVGKTTLAREVCRKAREEKLFDEVIMVTVTIDVDVIKIQNTIADFLGLDINEKSEDGRAVRLCKRLKKEKKILIILDDLWKKLKLEEVGIPQPGEHNGCKLLLTSRDFYVLSNEMGSQKVFPISALAGDEAWDLFQKMSNSNVDDPELQCIAKDVAKVCAGLPIAIVTVASSLKGKSLVEWKDALNKLNTTPWKGLTDMQATVYSPIEFSYHKLDSEELQSTFLLCCQMGYNATIRDMLKYGMGLDLFDVDTVQNAQYRVYSLVQQLKARCLLLEGDSNRQLVIHDLVRDVGRWIAYRDHGVVVLDDRNNRKEWADEEKIKTYRSIWLYNNLDELQEELQCPDLVFIHIDGSNGHLQLPDNLFNGLRQLRVLSLTSFNFSSLSSFVGLLKSLKTLCFYHSSYLGDLTYVGELKNLEVLSFAESNIRHLPKEIGELTKLKLLDLSDCYMLKVIPSNVFSKLSRLEELYMANSFDSWEMEGGDNASLTELKHLHSLSNLEIAIRDSDFIPEGFFSGKLCRYRIFIGKGTWNWEKQGGIEIVKTLKLKLGASTNMPNGVLQLLKETQDLHLHVVKNILCELDSEGFPILRHLRLRSSPGVKYLIDMIESDPLVAFPMLETLILENLVSLEKFCQCRLKMQPFSKLRYVRVEGCNKLTHLFSFMVAQGLLQLQKIKVSYCESIEEIVGEESEANMDEIVFSKLHTLTLSSLPKLNCFCSKGKQQVRLSKKKSRLWKAATSKQDLMKTSITPLLNGKISFPNLKTLKLESIKCDTLWHGPLATVGNSFQNLTELSIASCENVKYLFSYSLTKHLCRLKKLSLYNCEEMEEVIGMEGEQSMNKKVIVFPELLQLGLVNIGKLKRFCKGYLLECPLLKELKIGGCPDLKTFITREHEEMRSEGMDQNATPALFDDMVTFPSLVEMEMRGLDSVESIWDNQLASGSFGELRKLSIINCEKLRKVFPSAQHGRFQKLEKLTVLFSKLVEEIFEDEGGSNNHVISFQLRDLVLSRLPKLKNVFPYSIATHLQKLERIDISESGAEQIVAAKAEMDVCFVFPELTTLRFARMPELRRWYPGMHTLRLPKLKHLKIQIDMQFPVLLPREVICNLQEFELLGKEECESKPWHDIFPADLFSTLKVLLLHHFHDWEGIPVSILQEFHNLEKIRVEHCAFQEVFAFDGSVTAEVVERLLPRFKHLELYGLKDMRYMCEQQNHIFHLSALFPSLETLKVEYCDSLVSVAPSSTTVSFQNLTSLILLSCDKLVNIVTTTTAKSLSNLVTLEVQRCLMVTEIVEEREGENDDVEITFTKLQKLTLCVLESLTSFSSGNYGFSFPSLNEVTVAACPRMKLFSPGLLLNTPKLQNVSIHLSANEKGRWEGNLNATIRQLHTEMVGYQGLGRLKLSKFPEFREIWHGQLLVKLCSQLSLLEVDGCSNFSTAVPFNRMLYLSHLWTLRVSECDSLEGVFDLEKLQLNLHALHDELLPELEKLCLSDLPRLHHIFPTHPPPIFDFKNLKSLKLGNCSSLKTVLTTSMALCLVKLYIIEIINCIALEEIITHQENAGELVAKEQEIFIFPLLQIIVLESLPNLISFNSGSGILDFSSLESITVDNCPNMKPFISSFLRGQVSKAVGEIQPVATTSLIDDEKVAFPKLTELRMDWNDAMEEIGCGQFQAKFFCHLRTLAIINLPYHHLTFPSHFLLRFHNVENLALENAMFEEITTIHERTNGEDTSVGSLVKLRKLTLSNLPRLVHLAREDSPLSSIFQNLETLEVFECGRLETLVPSTICFQTLTTLQVSKCHKLLYLMTCTTAKSLVMLTRMSIKECQMLEQIVGNEENVAESEVTLTKLECLELHCLPSLLGFSLQNCAFTFPSLKDVIVRECPKMKIFSQGVVTAPKLRRVRQTEGKERRCWKDSLNATIQKLYTDQAMLQSSQPSSPRRNGKSHMSGGLSSEDFCEIKNPSVSKDLSPDTITKDHEENPIQDQSLSTPMDISSNSQAQMDGLSTDQNKIIPPSSAEQSVTEDLSPDAFTKHNEAEEEPIQDLSLSTPMGVPSISQAQMDGFSTDQDKTIPPASSEQSVNVCERPASDFCEDHISKPVFKGLLPGHNMTQIPSTYQHSRAIAEYDQDDPFLNQNLSTAMEIGNYFVSQEQVLSDAVPTPYAAPEPATVSTSESKNRTHSSLELTSSLSSKPSSKPPNITQSSFQPALSLITPAESCNSILETKGYSMSMQVMKNVLSKPLTEVASSTDRALLLSTLKNLIKCQSHLLNAQQVEAIQDFIQNFGSIVAYHPFHENQIEQVGAFKLSVEDKKKGISMLKNHYEDLAQKSTSLVADKEALIKRLREIEEEEDKIREDMKDVHAKIVTDSGTLEEAYTILLPELDCEQKEAEAKVCSSNSQWAKMRSLFT